MSSELRKRFAATSTSALKKQKEQEVEDLSLKEGGGNYHEIKEGTNKFRLYPSHTPGGAFMIPRGRRFGDILGDDGKVKKTSVIDGRIHGKGLVAPENRKKLVDICDQYIDAAKSFMEDEGADDVAAIIKSLSSYPKGINVNLSWLAYADTIPPKDSGLAPKFGGLEFKKSVRDGINAASLIEDEDEALDVDPFTDPDEGRAAIITYDKSAANSQKYAVKVGKQAIPLSDEQLEKFTEVKPLEELWGDTLYTKEDALRAFDICEYADEDLEIGFCATPEWAKMKKEYLALFGWSKTSSVKDSKKKSDDDDDDDEPKPKSKGKVMKQTDDDDDDDERVAKKKKKVDDDDDEPVAKKKKKVDDEEEEEEDEVKPRKQSVAELLEKMKGKKK